MITRKKNECPHSVKSFEPDVVQIDSGDLNRADFKEYIKKNREIYASFSIEKYLIIIKSFRREVP